MKPDYIEMARDIAKDASTMAIRIAINILNAELRRRGREQLAKLEKGK